MTFVSGTTCAVAGEFVKILNARPRQSNLGLHSSQDAPLRANQRMAKSDPRRRRNRVDAIIDAVRALRRLYSEYAWV